MPSTAKSPWEQLREPFPPEQIGKLPKPTKRDNVKGKCSECGGWHGLPAIHLDYVGHAATTDRLLKVDPEWSWEPMGVDAHGNPAVISNDGGMADEPYGLWIKLTVNGVTRPGFGGGKNAKECISDAIRNAAMRFGVALDLWAKEDLLGETAPKEKPKFTDPTKNGQPDEEAVKLATELLELVGQIGEGNGTKTELVPATQALIGQHAGDKAWLKRQIAAAKKNLADSVPFG